MNSPSKRVSWNIPGTDCRPAACIHASLQLILGILAQSHNSKTFYPAAMHLNCRYKSKWSWAELWPCNRHLLVPFCICVYISEKMEICFDACIYNYTYSAGYLEADIRGLRTPSVPSPQYPSSRPQLVLQDSPPLYREIYWNCTSIRSELFLLQ